jgi:hypothetical protein
MSEHARDDTGGIEADRTVGELITALATADTFIVYDRNDHGAWVESTFALALDGMR